MVFKTLSQTRSVIMPFKRNRISRQAHFYLLNLNSKLLLKEKAKWIRTATNIAIDIAIAIEID